MLVFFTSFPDGITFYPNLSTVNGHYVGTFERLQSLTLYNLSVSLAADKTAVR